MVGGVARVLALVSVGLISPVASARQDLSLKPLLKTGDEFAYAIGMILDVQQTLGEGQPAQTTSLKASGLLRMKVVDASPDGSARLEGVFDRAMVKAPIGDQDAGFEWPSTTPITDETPALGRLGQSLEKSTILINVDASGRATVEGGLERFAEAASKVDYPDERYVGFFTEEQLSAALTPIFQIDGAGLSPRQVGKGWQTTETVALPPAGAIDVTTDISVYDSDPDAVNCGGGVGMTLRRPENPGDDDVRLSLDPTSGGGIKIQFDRRRSLLKFRKQSLTIKTQWQLGDVNVRQTQVSVLNLTLEE